MRSPDNVTPEDGLSAPESRAGRLQRACLALLRQHEREGTIPTNGRFLFYELEQQGVVAKAYRDASGPHAGAARKRWRNAAARPASKRRAGAQTYSTR